MTLPDTTDFDPGDEDDHRADYVHDDPDPCPWCGGKIRMHRAWVVPVPAKKRDLQFIFDPNATAYYTDVVCCGDPVCKMRARRFAELQGWSPAWKLQQTPLWHAEREIDWGFAWMKESLTRVP